MNYYEVLDWQSRGRGFESHLLHGRILQATYPDGDIVDYTYTNKGELYSIESTAPGDPSIYIVQETQYNGFGQIGKLKYGNGTETTYNYASSAFTGLSLDYLNKSTLYASSVDGKATQGGSMTTLVARDYQYSNLGMVTSLSKGVHASLAAGVTALDYSFSYDDKGRLSGSTLATGGSNIYEMTMGYNAAGGITSKASHRPGGHALVDPNLDYELSYTYHPSKPHQLLSVTDAGPQGGLTRFTYDGVGNLINMSGPSGTEELIWNELQQLSGVKNGSGIHHYVYDHSGERIMKSSINRSSVQVNDQTIDDIQYLEPYTLYVNPYFVVTSFQNGDRASKHYYMNTQRVATDISINYQGPPPPAAPGAQGAHSGTQSAPIGLSASLEQDINQVLHQFGAGEISGALSEDGVAIETYYPKAATESESTNRILYWYHPDYLGSVDLVTDRNGLAYEFFLYTPWGEDMYHYNAGSSSFSSPYRFNGKEKDPETGYHYYGARYYQSKFSVWMSVDPLAMKPHNMPLTPYHFSANNPVNIVDPDGNDWYTLNGDDSAEPVWFDGNDEIDGYTNHGSVMIALDVKNSTTTQYYNDGSWNTTATTILNEVIVTPDAPLHAVIDNPQDNIITSNPDILRIPIGYGCTPIDERTIEATDFEKWLSRNFDLNALQDLTILGKGLKQESVIENAETWYIRGLPGFSYKIGYTGDSVIWVDRNGEPTVNAILKGGGISPYSRSVPPTKKDSSIFRIIGPGSNK